jgi:hypothetical protein
MFDFIKALSCGSWQSLVGKLSRKIASEIRFAGKYKLTADFLLEDLKFIPSFKRNHFSISEAMKKDFKIVV